MGFIFRCPDNPVVRRSPYIVNSSAFIMLRCLKPTHASVEMSEFRTRCPLCHDEWLDIVAFSERSTTERLRLASGYFAAILASEGGRLPLYRAQALSLRGIDNVGSRLFLEHTSNSPIKEAFPYSGIASCS